MDWLVWCLKSAGDLPGDAVPFDSSLSVVGPSCSFLYCPNAALTAPVLRDLMNCCGPGQDWGGLLSPADSLRKGAHSMLKKLPSTTGWTEPFSFVVLLPFSQPEIKLQTILVRT